MPAFASTSSLIDGSLLPFLMSTDIVLYQHLSDAAMANASDLSKLQSVSCDPNRPDGKLT